MAVVRERWAELLACGDVSVVDSIEQGLTDPIRDINMAGAAEVSAQMHGISRSAQHAYARESFRRARARARGWAGKYEANKLNPHGGSIALGHPLGATGARLLLSLLHGLQRDPKARLGMIAACAQGGVGGAMVVERE